MDGGGRRGWCSFFLPFLNRTNSFLAKKINQICNSGDMMGYVVLIDLSM